MPKIMKKRILYFCLSIVIISFCTTGCAVIDWIYDDDDDAPLILDGGALDGIDATPI